MVRLNRTPLETKQIDRLLLQLATVVSPQQPLHAQTVLMEILGKEEQIMTAKRMAVIVLILEGFSSYKISHLLKLSESTVASIAKRVNDGEYSIIIQTLGKSKKNYFKVLEAVDSILHLGGILPHYNGLDRYKWMGSTPNEM